MIVTDRFVFLHLHKSGGTFVNEGLLRFVPGAREVGYHLPRALVPGDARELPVLGFVRNPWSYYVSWHAFQSQRPQPNALFRVASDDGRLDFRGTVANLLNLAGDDVRFDRLLDLLPDAYGNRGLNLPRFALAPLRGTDLGFYSFLYRYMHGEPDGRERIGRMEALRDELPAMLEWTGTPVSPALRDYIARAERRNATPHAGYVDYYDADLRDLVAARDALVIERHGYRFGD